MSISRSGGIGVLAVVVAIGACSAVEEPAASPATSAADPSLEPSAVTSIPTSVVSAPESTETRPVDRSWATRLVAEADPVTLEQTGPGIPAGYWVEQAVVTDEVVGFVTWSEEETDRVDARWRLVIADRASGEVLMEDRVGDMNPIGMFAVPSGEVIVVEPIRSSDWNHADGFVVRSYDPVSRNLREVASFNEGAFLPFTMTVLGDGLIGVSGSERNQDGIFDRMRIVVYDWAEQSTVVDVTLDDLPLHGDSPEGVFVDSLGHGVAWDLERGRAIVVHAHEDVATTVDYPSGNTETVDLVNDQTLLGALFSWLVPPAYAKGLPSSARNVTISGDRLYVASSAITYTEADDSLAYSYQPLGILSIDLETLTIVNRSEAPVGFVAAVPTGGYLIGGGRFEAGRLGTYVFTDEQSTSGLLVIDPERLDVVDSQDLELAWPHSLQPAINGEAIYIDGGSNGLLRFDTTTGTITKLDTTTPWEPALIRHGLRYTRHAN